PGIRQRAPGDYENADYGPKNDCRFAHDRQRNANRGGIAERAQNYSVTRFVNADCSRHKCEGEINYFGERFDDVSGTETRSEAKHPERDVNFENARHVRREIERNHGEERRATSLVEAVNCQLDTIDVMAPAAQKVWAKTAPRQSIDDVRQQRDTLARCHSSRNQSQKRHGRNDDEHLARDWRYRVSE